jgi:hypothetical protein
MEFGTLVQHRQYQRKYLAVAEARTIYQIIEAMACLYLGCRRSLPGSLSSVTGIEIEERTIHVRGNKRLGQITTTTGFGW